jgi:hypothetical protein
MVHFHLLRFLYADDLELTNTLADRMLRPAVATVPSVELQLFL